jgi:cell division protease FtsH
VATPEVLGREAILQLHARNTPLGPDVDLREIARRTTGLSGAFLANIINEGAILAARENAEFVSARHLDEAVDRTTIGAARHLKISDAVKRKTAYHEAGHVLTNLLGAKPEPVNKVTVLPHGNAGGFAESGSEDGDKYGYMRDELEAMMTMAVGGLAAEKLIYGQWSTGPSNDLEKATKIARLMVEKLGMSDKVGFIVTDHPEDNPYSGRRISEATAREIDLEVKRLLDEAVSRAERILTDHRDILESMKDALMTKETLNRQAIEDIVAAGKKKAQ